MARNCGCAGASCGCLVIAGAGVTITGIGTAADPFVVVAELGNLTSALSLQDSGTVTFSVAGSGTPSDPMVVSATALRQPFPAYTTAGRPSAVASGVGAYYYDTTTSTPMWSDGASWIIAGSGGVTWGSITGTLSSQADLQAALNAKITAFADPGADRIVFWDDSAGAFAALTASTGLSISGTSITASSASETAAGIVERATQAETDTGTDDTRYVSPLKLATRLAAVRARYSAINAQTGTTYAPLLADESKLVTLSNAAAITVTLPSDATQAFPVGATIDFTVIGAGMATFSPDTGTTVNATPSATTRAQWSTVTAIKLAANSWLVVGDLA